MQKYGENKDYDNTLEDISDNSTWIVSTPTLLAQTLPFYVIEAGHFTANSDYRIQRDTHDSFLLIYTINGQGAVQTGDNIIQLHRGYAVLIDCHIPHEYRTASDTWEFLWIHLKGSGLKPLFDIIYPDAVVNAVNMKDPYDFENMTAGLINKAHKNDVASCVEISLNIHSLLDSVYVSTLEIVSRKNSPTDDVQRVISFIETNYSSIISVDDMIQNIHVSKYHFIRYFRRVMGITPYSYLTNYRINISKKLLRTTDKTVSEIAELCGFLDTSNFIVQFKKRTGQKPLQYKRDFS